MQGDLDETDEGAVAEARDLVDRAQASLPSSLEDEIGPMFELMERGITAAEDGGDPNEVFDADPGSVEVVMNAAEAMETYRTEECEAPAP